MHDTRRTNIDRLPNVGKPRKMMPQIDTGPKQISPRVIQRLRSQNKFINNRAMRKDHSGRITLDQPRNRLTRLPGRPQKEMLEPKRLPNINRVYMN